MLKGKHILLGVTGGIAAYKACELASALVKQHADVHVVMTENAMQFVSPLTFDALTHNRTVTDTFDRQYSFEIEHISLAELADAVMIAPASADVIAKLAAGMADDMLTTTVLACTCAKMIAPAMNTAMYGNPATQRNLRQLSEDGFEVIGPDSGRLACGTAGRGKLVPVAALLEAVDHAIARKKDMRGLKVLVTAGPTQEALDPVRFLTNHSSGKMGYAIAEAASGRGAEVTLVSGPTNLPRPHYTNFIPVVTAQDMYDAVISAASDQDLIIKAAAVADFRPEHTAANKIKKTVSTGNTEYTENTENTEKAEYTAEAGKKETASGEEEILNLPLVKTRDILGYLGEHKRSGQLLCGFSMETENVLENSRRKLLGKHLDMVAANNVKEEGAGFAVDTNHLTLLTEDGTQDLPMMSKTEAADALLDALIQLRKKSDGQSPAAR